MYVLCVVMLVGVVKVIRESELMYRMQAGMFQAQAYKEQVARLPGKQGTRMGSKWQMDAVVAKVQV